MPERAEEIPGEARARLRKAEKLDLPWVDISEEGQTEFGLLAIRKLGTVIDVADFSEETQPPGARRVARQDLSGDAPLPDQLIFGNSQFEEIASVTLREGLTFGQAGGERIIQITEQMSDLRIALTEFDRAKRSTTTMLAGIANNLFRLGVEEIFYPGEDLSLSGLLVPDPFPPYHNGGKST